MFDDVLTPSSQAFTDWGYTALECIEQLEQLRLYTDTDTDADADLSLLEEWVALSLETQSVAYYEQDYKTVAKIIEGIAAAVLSINVTHLVPLRKHPFLLHNGLRAILSQTYQNPEPSHLVQLYRLLPVLPDAKSFDIHIMFQCFFGFENVLKQWYENFDYYAKDNNWLNHNALQLQASRVLLAGHMHDNHPLIAELDTDFEKYVLTVVDRPLAAEWFPWLLWFIGSKV